MDLQNADGRKELGKRIQSAIAEAGYPSLPLFAKELGCSRALIYQYVNGDVLVQLSRLEHIAKLTRKPLEWFFVSASLPDPDRHAALEQRLEQADQEAEELRAHLGREMSARAQERANHRASLAGVLRELCLARRNLGDAAGVLEIAPRWLEVAEDIGDQRAVIDANLQMGHAWLLRGELPRARSCVEEGLASARQLGDARAEDSARQELVRVLQASGQVAEAREHARELAHANRWWPRWSALATLAALSEQTGDLETAQEYLDQADEVINAPDQKAAHKTMATAYLASNRVNIALARGDYLRAARSAEELQALASRANLPDQAREATLDTAVAQLRSGKLARALTSLERLVQWADAAGDVRLVGFARVFASECLRQCGDTAEARRAARQSLDHAAEVSSGHLMAEAELALGLAHLDEGHYDDARHHLLRCVSRADRLQLRRVLATCELALAQALVQTQDVRAPEELRRVAQATEATGYLDLHIAARLALEALDPRPEALDAAAELTDQAQQLGYFQGRLNGLVLQARCHLSEGRLDAADVALRRAARLVRQSVRGCPRGRPPADLTSLCTDLLEAYRNRGQDDRAKQVAALLPAHVPQAVGSVSNGI